MGLAHARLQAVKHAFDKVLGNWRVCPHHRSVVLPYFNATIHNMLSLAFGIHNEPYGYNWWVSVLLTDLR